MQGHPGVHNRIRRRDSRGLFGCCSTWQAFKWLFTVICCQHRWNTTPGCNCIKHFHQIWQKLLLITSQLMSNPMSDLTLLLFVLPVFPSCDPQFVQGQQTNWIFFSFFHPERFRLHVILSERPFWTVIVILSLHGQLSSPLLCERDTCTWGEFWWCVTQTCRLKRRPKIHWCVQSILCRIHLSSAVHLSDIPINYFFLHCFSLPALPSLRLNWGWQRTLLKGVIDTCVDDCYRIDGPSDSVSQNQTKLSVPCLATCKFRPETRSKTWQFGHVRRAFTSAMCVKVSIEAQGHGEMVSIVLNCFKTMKQSH